MRQSTLPMNQCQRAETGRQTSWGRRPGCRGDWTSSSWTSTSARATATAKHAPRPQHDSVLPPAAVRSLRRPLLRQYCCVLPADPAAMGLPDSAAHWVLPQFRAVSFALYGTPPTPRLTLGTCLLLSCCCAVPLLLRASC